MNSCSFCRIITRQAHGYIIDENDLVITFLSLENHPLVVPKQHIADIYSLDDVTEPCDDVNPHQDCEYRQKQDGV